MRKNLIRSMYQKSLEGSWHSILVKVATRRDKSRMEMGPRHGIPVGLAKYTPNHPNIKAWLPPIFGPKAHRSFEPVSMPPETPSKLDRSTPCRMPSYIVCLGHLYIHEEGLGSEGCGNIDKKSFTEPTGQKRLPK